MQNNFDISTLNGKNGFVIEGTYASSTAGDINGDGLDDLVIGTANSVAGMCYVLFGTRNVFPLVFNLTSLNGNNGFVIPGVVTYGKLGSAVSTAGDINGDGLADLILGANKVDQGTERGFSYVIFGSRNAFSAIFNLTNLNGSNGFFIPGVVIGGNLGIAVSTAGDINGDGIDDLALGTLNKNIIYVLFGTRDAFPSIFDLTSLNGSNGFAIRGIVPGGYFGSTVNTAGDINGDGCADLILGANTADSVSGVNRDTGAVYVLFGSRNSFPAFFNLSSLNGSNGFVIYGTVSSGYLGYSVDTAGDLNGDGLSDLILGAYGVGSGAGASYVLFGSFSNFPAFFDLNTLNGTNGFIIPGVVSGALGYAVSTAGDLNADGLSDLVLGAYGAYTSTTMVAGAYRNRGASYVLLGSRSIFPVSFDLNSLNGTNGMLILGTEWIQLGYSVGTAGDFNGDNAADLLVRSASSASYIIFGGLSSLRLSKNALNISQGQAVVLTSENLSAAGFVIFNSLVFTLTQVQGGKFALITNPTTPVFNFTQQQINSGQVEFISDRTAPVTYQVGIYNTSDNQTVLQPTQANVTFTNHVPVVLNTPSTQIIAVNQPFQFTLAADKIFNDSDEDPLTYSVQSSDTFSLPNWLTFNASQSNKLTFSGTAPSVGGTGVSLIAKDPLNETASVNFEILAQPGNGTTINNLSTASSAQIAGGVIGGLFGLGTLVSMGYCFWKNRTNEASRKIDQFADLVRSGLNLKGVDNFNSDVGQKYIGTIQNLQNALKAAGIDSNTMREQELQVLANDVSDACRNKITHATDCFGRSVITVSDINNNLQNLVNEVQVLRTSNQQFVR